MVTLSWDKDGNKYYPDIVPVKILYLDSYNLFEWGEPRYETSGAAGFDLRTTEDILLLPMTRQIAPTGIKLEFPITYQVEIRPRSGMAARDGVTVLNAPGTIDSDYRDEIKVILVNLSNETIQYKRGDRIAQGVLMPVSHATFVNVNRTDVVKKDHGQKERTGGFGSTGNK